MRQVRIKQHTTSQNKTQPFKQRQQYMRYKNAYCDIGYCVTF